MIIGNGCHIRQLVSPYEFASLIYVLIHLTVDILTVRCAGIVPTFTLVDVVVVAESGFEFQIRNKLIFAVDGVEVTGDIFAAWVVCLRKQWVAVVVAYEFAVPCSVLVIHRVRRNDTVSRTVERRCITCSLAIHVLIYLGKEHIGTQSETVTCLVFCIHPSTDALDSRICSDTFLVEVSKRTIVLKPLGTSRYRSLIVLMISLLEEDVIPVNISAPWYRCIFVDILIGIFYCLFLSGFVIDYLSRLQSVVDVFTSLLSAHDRAIVHSKVRESPVWLECYRGFSHLSFLGSDEDNSVCGSRTIKGCCCGILYHCDVFNVGCVDSAHDVKSCISIQSWYIARHCGYSVDDIKRRVGGVERTHTADVDWRGRTWLAGRGTNLNARSGTLKQSRERHCRYVLQLTCLNGGGRTGIGRLLVCSITSDHNLLKQLVFRFEHDIQFLSAFRHHILRLKTNVWNS